MSLSHWPCLCEKSVVVTLMTMSKDIKVHSIELFMFNDVFFLFSQVEGMTAIASNQEEKANMNKTSSVAA